MPDTFRVDLDTSYLRFDPNSGWFLRNIIKEIPAFGEYESEFARTDAGKTRLFAWIVIMYDINTPLRREIKDMYKRKVYAGSLCGITPNALSGKYRDCFENIFVGKDKDVNTLIVKFITSFSSAEYTQLVAHAAIQYSMLEKIVAGKADKGIQEVFDRATDKMKSLEHILYGTGERDEVYEARRALYKQVAYDLSDMRAESVARTIISEGKLPDEWSPYEEGYEPGSIGFIGDDPNVARNDEEALP
jgi:hypothetical protein